MTLGEWTNSITEELKGAGFEVGEYQGFPIVAMPKTHQEGVRFLKFKTTLAADRTIYAEGCLFTPAGSMDYARRRKDESRNAHS